MADTIRQIARFDLPIGYWLLAFGYWFRVSCGLMVDSTMLPAGRLQHRADPKNLATALAPGPL